MNIFTKIRLFIQLEFSDMFVCNAHRVTAEAYAGISLFMAVFFGGGKTRGLFGVEDGLRRATVIGSRFTFDMEERVIDGIVRPVLTGISENKEAEATVSPLAASIIDSSPHGKEMLEQSDSPEGGEKLNIACLDAMLITKYFDDGVVVPYTHTLHEYMLKTLDHYEKVLTKRAERQEKGA